MTKAELIDLLEALTSHLGVDDLIAGSYQDMAPFDDFDTRHWALLVRWLSGEGFDDDGGVPAFVSVPDPDEPGPRAGRHENSPPPTPEQQAWLDELESTVERTSPEPLRLGGGFDGVTLP